MCFLNNCYQTQGYIKVDAIGQDRFKFRKQFTRLRLVLRVEVLVSEFFEIHSVLIHDTDYLVQLLSAQLHSA